MSLIITVYSDEGIVMAADSRTTVNGRHSEGDKLIQDFAIHYTETANKIFLCPNNVGIAVCNDASYNGRLLSGYLQSFILNEIEATTPVSEVPLKLQAFMGKLSPSPDTLFHVAGYEKVDNVYKAKVWHVIPRQQKVAEIKTEASGATWNGEIDILVRLLKPVFIQGANGEMQEVKTAAIPWNFSIYAIRTTIDTMRFQVRPKTVGGPIDILVLRPNEGYWVKKKTLHAD